MQVYKNAKEVKNRIEQLRADGKSIGLVPTMGALHEGHLSLIIICKKQNDYTVVSIFVNPNQFNDKNDLDRYPRTPERDINMLREAGCDILFMPDTAQIYPEPDTRIFDFGGLDKLMEGLHRPGHFNGVAQVVTRLFDIIQPHRAYFGIKDFQQLAIIKRVVKDMNYGIEIIGCPIVREPDGLAMSSRNMILDPGQRKQALALYQALTEAKEMSKKHTPAEVKDFVLKYLHSAPGVKPEYFEIIDGDTLLPAGKWDRNRNITGCLAAVVGGVRLIDNMDFSL